MTSVLPTRFTIAKRQNGKNGAALEPFRTAF
jgi:hypothetical protein